MKEKKSLQQVSRVVNKGVAVYVTDFQVSRMVIWEIQNSPSKRPIFQDDCHAFVQLLFSRLQMFLCENAIYTQSAMENVLTHELIHAYDNCRIKYDPDNVKHLACTEVFVSSILHVYGNLLGRNRNF